jgi:hypothetical protein
MGTPCACIYATTTYGYHEKTKILPRHTQNLALLGRFIDDMLGVWIGPEEEWPRFQQSLQGFGKLTWICSDRSSSVVFLDLTLSITPSNTITSQTYQKPLNLYLYIPPTSSHPSSCFTGTIVGNILRFWRQNPDLSHYRRLVSDFATHLIDRGYTTPTAERAMLSAAAKIDAKAKLPENNTPHPPSPSTAGPKRLYLHWRYSANGLVRNTLRHLYNKHLIGHDRFDEMVVAFSRPKNIGDLLTNTVLNELPGNRMSDIIASSRLTTTMKPPGSANLRSTTECESTDAPPELPPHSIQV